MTKSNSKQTRAKKTQEHENRQSANEQFARRIQLLVVARDGVYLLGGENIRYGELGSTRRATKNTRCGELGTTRQATENTRCGELGTTCNTPISRLKNFFK